MLGEAPTILPPSRTLRLHRRTWLSAPSAASCRRVLRRTLGQTIPKSHVGGSIPSPPPCAATACSNAGRFCRRPRKAVSAAGSAKAQARDSLSIVLSPPLLTRMDESLYGSQASLPDRRPPPQRQFAGCDRGTWALRVTRRQLLYRRSSAGGDAWCSAAQIQAAPAPARHGKIRPARTWSARLQARHARPFCTKARCSPLPCSIHSIA